MPNGYKPEDHQFDIPPNTAPHHTHERHRIKRLHSLKRAANRLTLFNLPYGLGAGHSDPVPDQPQALDCSSTVSWLLQQAGYHVHTMTSSGFTTYGEAGAGKHVTIWAKGPDGPTGHVYMEIDGKFVSTGVNNKRGPGITDNYRPSDLSAYVPRHPKGM